MKMTTTSLLASAFVLAIATPANAAQEQPTAAEATAEGNPVSQIVCRRLPPPTGTRIGTRRVCKSQREWNAIEQEARDTLENAGTRSRAGNSGG